MFTSEVELQWRVEVGREALDMIKCFPFLSHTGGQRGLKPLEEPVRPTWSSL